MLYCAKCTEYRNAATRYSWQVQYLINHMTNQMSITQPYLCCHQTRASRHLRSPSTHTNVARTRRLSCRQRHLKILYVCHILHIQRCCHYCPPNAVQSQNIPDNKRTLYFYHLHSDSISRWYVFSSFRYFMSGCGCSTT